MVKNSVTGCTVPTTLNTIACASRNLDTHSKITKKKGKKKVTGKTMVKSSGLRTGNKKVLFFVDYCTTSRRIKILRPLACFS